MTADLAIVVVTYNSARVIDGLLDSIPAALDGAAAEIVVVDNGSSDDTVERLERRTDCTVVRSKYVGYSAGINRGVAAAGDASTVLVLNPDVRLEPKCVPALFSGLAESGVGIVVPQIRSASGDLDRTLRRYPSLLRAIGLNGTRIPLFAESLGRDTEYVFPRAVDWATGAVMLISRECWVTVGEWDESFFLYSEETDYCARARDLGFRTWYVPQAVAVHLAGQSGRNDWTHSMQAVNRVRFYRRRHSLAASWVYFALTVLTELSWVARGNTVSRAAVRALLLPRHRPQELGCSRALMPS